MFRCYMYRHDEVTEGVEFYLDLDFSEAWKTGDDVLAFSRFDRLDIWNELDDKVYMSERRSEGVVAGRFVIDI